MNKRDAVLALLALGVTPLSAVAQPASKVFRIGMMSASFPRSTYDYYFRMLRDAGYEEGRNLIVDFRYLQGQSELRPSVAAELVAANPDVLVGPTNPHVLALKRATTTIPIVMLTASEPVVTGLVASLARPGGNVTGTTTNGAEMAGKMTEVLRDTIPHMSRVTWLSDPDYPGMNLYIRSVDEAAKAMKIRAVHLPVRTLADLDAALKTVEHDRPDAIGLAITGPVAEYQRRIIEFAARLKLPALYSTATPVRNGGLMSYGPDFRDLWRRNVAIVDKLLRGMRPGEIPVEEPSKFLLTINLSTSKAMGVVFPESILIRADEVIQ